MVPRRPAFSLLEVMVTVAIIGVIAALAVPAMLPMVRANRSRAAAETVASMLEDARRRAVNEGRCYRITLPTASSIGFQRRASVDCTNDAAFTTDPWDTETRVAAVPGATLSIVDTAAVGAPDKMIFRPNSRLRGAGTLTTTQYGARVLVTMTGGGFAMVDVDAHGRICARTSPTTPAALTAPVTCP